MVEPVEGGLVGLDVVSSNQQVDRVWFLLQIKEAGDKVKIVRIYTLHPCWSSINPVR